MSDSGPVTMPTGTTLATPEGNIATAPDTQVGQATPSQSQQPGQATSAPAVDEPTFFDPSTLPPELMPGYKQMQAAFTKKMQGVSKEKQKIDIYNRFETDPAFQAQVLQQLAAQHGYQLTRKEAQNIVNSQNQDQDYQPQSWNEVFDRAKSLAKEEILAELQPLIGKVQKVTASNIERELGEIDPQWRNYEDEMRANLAEHPSLVNNVAKLYRLSVPEEVLTSKAVQQAMAKFQSKAEQVKVSGTTRTSRSEPASPDITKMKDVDAFNAAVQIAKQKLASGG